MRLLTTSLSYVVGVAVGALAATLITVGEAQVRLAAAGAAVGVGAERFILIDPQWATAVALALALLLVGGATVVWQTARSRAPRAFWLATAIAPLLVSAIGTSLAPAMLDTRLRGGVDEMLATTAHSPLLLAVVVGAAVAWNAHPVSESSPTAAADAEAVGSR